MASFKGGDLIAAMDGLALLDADADELAAEDAGDFDALAGFGLAGDGDGVGGGVCAAGEGEGEDDGEGDGRGFAVHGLLRPRLGGLAGLRRL